MSAAGLLHLSLSLWISDPIPSPQHISLDQKPPQPFWSTFMEQSSPAQPRAVLWTSSAPANQARFTHYAATPKAAVTKHVQLTPKYELCPSLQSTARSAFSNSPRSDIPKRSPNLSSLLRIWKYTACSG